MSFEGKIRDRIVRAGWVGAGSLLSFVPVVRARSQTDYFFDVLLTVMRLFSKLTGRVFNTDWFLVDLTTSEPPRPSESLLWDSRDFLWSQQ